MTLFGISCCENFFRN